MILENRIKQSGGIILDNGVTVDAAKRVLSGFDDSFVLDLHLAQAIDAAGVIIPRDRQEEIWEGFTKPEQTAEESAWSEIEDALRLNAEAGVQPQLTAPKHSHDGSAMAIAVPGIRPALMFFVDWFKATEGAVNFLGTDVWDGSEHYQVMIHKYNGLTPLDRFTEQKAETEFWKKAFEELLAYDGFEDSSDPNSYEDWHLMDAFDPNSKTARIMLGLWKLGKITDSEVVRLCEQIREAA